jgi:hypothetical protein
LTSFNPPFNPFFNFIDTLLARPGLDIDFVLDTSLISPDPCMLSRLTVLARRVSMMMMMMDVDVLVFVFPQERILPISDHRLPPFYIVRCKVCPFPFTRPPTLSKRAVPEIDTVGEVLRSDPA